MSAKKRISELEGNAIDAIKDLASKKDVVQKYFYFDSPTWKAIWDHIAKAKDCVLIDRITERHGMKVSIACHRGTGPDITLKSFHHYCDSFEGPENKRVPSPVFHMTIAVGYDLDENKSEFSKEYSLSVPVELEEVGISKTEFDARWKKWIKNLKDIRDSDHRVAHLKLLKNLVAGYPEETQEFLDNL